MNKEYEKFKAGNIIVIQGMEMLNDQSISTEYVNMKLFKRHGTIVLGQITVDEVILLRRLLDNNLTPKEDLTVNEIKVLEDNWFEIGKDFSREFYFHVLRIVKEKNSPLGSLTDYIENFTNCFGGEETLEDEKNK